MPKPIRSQNVLATRAVTLWVLRAVSIFLMVYGVFLVLARITHGLIQRDGWVSMTAYMGVGSDHGIVRGFPMALAGVVLALLSRKLSRWIVAVPESGCVRCSYPRLGKPGICPECGYDDGEPSAGSD
ncbi:MAG: hypothetical protein ED559_02345 [Phycisphaera sp.]|nr:MAG: hypothetical protein ED559_02345 [Phycisphaera sp.]